MYELPPELSGDFSDPQLVSYAESRVAAGEPLEALWLCLRALSETPGNSAARLLLAKILYQLECFPFAADQVEILAQKLPENVALQRLLQKFRPEGSYRSQPATQSVEESAAEEATVAESEFDFGEITLLDEDGDKD